MKKVGLMIIVLLIGVNIFAERFSKVGTIGAEFLKIGIDPKGIGMGEAYTAVTKDPFAIHWNPAGLALIKRPVIASSDVEWFAGIRNNFIAYIIPGALMGNVGLSLSALTSSQEPVTTTEDQVGNKYTTWSYTAIACGISYARMMTDKFAFGTNIRYLQEGIWDIRAQGIAMDMGMYFYPGYWGSLRFGFVIKNFGPKMCYGGGHLFEQWTEDGTESGISPTDIAKRATPYDLPLCIKLGLAYDIIDVPMNRLTVAADLSSPNDGAEKVHIGVENCIMKMLNLRIGYIYDPDIQEEEGTTDREEATARICGGVGVNYSIGGTRLISVDYAIQDMRKLGLAPRVAVNLEL
ncbi:MAG: PorV/PorQ family protein [Candidatus Stahlbacteria bacterium]|nr:PorV/PorQ family protein [Candidatus Stahlbacteria bacterium]